MTVTIAIDAMGGDFGPSVTIPATLSALQHLSYINVILVGDESVLQPLLSNQSYDKTRLTVQHASEVVAMDEHPIKAMRYKRDSSMRVAINLVKSGGAQACVSAGNTGALMATAKFVLKTLPGIDRPAILSALPTVDKDQSVRMLDLGANVDSSAEVLAQFAVMGSVIAESIGEIKNPSVKLLNIGEEDIKGNEQVKQTAQLLEQLDGLNYQGYIEGNAIFGGAADVVVCDGFVGNVALKTTEGVIAFIFDILKSSFKKNFMTKLAGLLVKPILKSVVLRINPDKYNGAVLIGLNGNVIKSHGNANAKAFANAICEAALCAEKHVPDLIRERVASLLSSPLSSQGE